jgi:hypothetical protein
MRISVLCVRDNYRRREYVVGRAVFAAAVLDEDPIALAREMVDGAAINGLTVWCRLREAGADWPAGLRVFDEPKELRRDRRFRPRPAPLRKATA